MWHYQIRKRIINEEELFDIVERYEDPMGWTKDSIAVIGDTKEELIESLESMLADAKKYNVLEDNEKE